MVGAGLQNTQRSFAGYVQFLCHSCGTYVCPGPQVLQFKSSVSDLLSNHSFLLPCLLFSPLIRVVDNLFMMGLWSNDDLEQILNLVDPVSFDPNYGTGEIDVESM